MDRLTARLWKLSNARPQPLARRLHKTPFVDETLTGDEREALRESIVNSVSETAKKKAAPKARPVALIAEDQAAERVMPTARPMSGESCRR